MNKEVTSEDLDRWIEDNPELVKGIVKEVKDEDPDIYWEEQIHD